MIFFKNLANVIKYENKNRLLRNVNKKRLYFLLYLKLQVYVQYLKIKCNQHRLPVYHKYKPDILRLVLCVEKPEFFYNRTCPFIKDLLMPSAHIM